MARAFAWTFERRIMPRVKTTENGCWEWQGSRTRNGYGQLRVAGTPWMAHRYAYVEKVGNIPAGMDLDHLCRNRACINPAHLEPVTRSENLKRGEVGRSNLKKTHCPNGHPYAGTNLYIHPAGRRCCRACTNARARRSREAKTHA